MKRVDLALMRANRIAWLVLMVVGMWASRTVPLGVTLVGCTVLLALNPFRSQSAEHGPCTHRPPSPGQSLCSCGHQRIEMEYAARIAEAAGRRDGTR